MNRSTGFGAALWCTTSAVLFIVAVEYCESRKVSHSYSATYSFAFACVLIAYVGSIASENWCRITFYAIARDIDILVAVFCVLAVGAWLQPARNADAFMVATAWIERVFIVPVVLLCCALIPLLRMIRSHTRRKRGCPETRIDSVRKRRQGKRP